MKRNLGITFLVLLFAGLVSAIAFLFRQLVDEQEYAQKLHVELKNTKRQVAELEEEAQKRKPLGYPYAPSNNFATKRQPTFYRHDDEEVEDDDAPSVDYSKPDTSPSSPAFKFGQGSRFGSLGNK